MKKYYLTLFMGMVFSLYSEAQIAVFTVLSGTSHIVKAGTPVFMDGLVLTPSKDLSLTGKELTHKSSATNVTINPNIKNYYSFNSPITAFTGSINFIYSDAELNGLKETDLSLNIFNPSIWILQKNTSINTAENFTTNTLTAFSMKELTLGICAPTSVVAANASQTICTGTSIGSIALSDALNATGTSFSWTRTNTGSVTGIASSGTGSIINGNLVNATSIPQATEFTITANRLNGCSSSTTATVMVNPKFYITSQPVNSSKVAGQTATFSVATTGLVTGYQWQQLTNTKNAVWTFLSNGGIYSGTNASTMTLTNITPDMNGYKYRCIVTGQCNAPITSNAATLTVTKSSNSTVISTTTNSIDLKVESTNEGEYLRMHVYPNPSLLIFNIQLKSSDRASTIHLKIMDVTGRVIEEFDRLNIEAVKEVGFYYRNGIYIVEATQGNQRVVLRMVKGG